MNRTRIRHLAGLGAAALAAAALAGCTLTTEGFTSRAPGARTTESREISDVSAVRLGTSGSVRVSVGEPSLTITAGEAVLERITTTVANRSLDIDLDGRWLNPGPIEYDLVLPALSSMTISGSGEIVGEVTPGRIAVEVTGSGRVLLDGVSAPSVAVSIQGSGSVTLNGDTDALAVRIPGSGRFVGTDLPSRTAVVSITGSGEARVLVAETLDASIAGSGQIRYLGDPEVTSSITGSGRIGHG